MSAAAVTPAPIPSVKQAHAFGHSCVEYVDWTFAPLVGLWRSLRVRFREGA